ncbi:MAG TPA: ABC transporter substrate-binding protein [Candidatus Binatia bacterium]
MKIKLLFALLWVVAASADAAPLFAQAPLQKVTISYSSSGITSIDFFIAKEKGFFREEGFEPQLIQMSANAAVAAGVTGELIGLSSIGSAIRAIQRGVPLRALSVSLRRPLFWLVARPEYKSVRDLKGKIMGIVTVGGSQYTAARKLMALHGLDPDKDITMLQAGEESRQLQALVTNAIQASAISPPWVLLARDKFKMNILDSSIDKFPSIQNGLAVNVKTLEEKRDLVKKLLRVKARAAQYYDGNERAVAEMLAKMWNTDVATAVESYRMSKPAFTVNGIPSDDEIKEHLALDAQTLKLAEPLPPAKVFDFTLQREVNRELGIR